MNRRLAGTGRLLRLALRRDRVLLASWIAGFVAMATLSSSATVGLYPDRASRLAAADTVNGSRALVALYGRVWDPTSIGALSMIKLGGLGAVFVAMLAIVVVVRHTRGDEEAGRTELLGAGAVGRLAPVAAALGEVVVAGAVLAMGTAVGLAATGLPVAGSVAFGLAWAGVALAFGAVAAVAAQLTSSARTATAASSTVLAVTYLLRAIGDAATATGPRWLSWLSPIGWSQQFRPFAGNRWWVLGITVTFAALTAALAGALATCRDLGSGWWPVRPGPPSAGASLRGPMGLAWRLQRASLLGWAIGFATMGALLGGLASTVGDFLNNPNARDLILKLGGVQVVEDAFLSAELGIAGVVAAAFGISSVARLRAEEVGLRAEPVLATAVGRLRWAAGPVALALGGSALLLALAGLGAGVADAATSGTPSQVGRVLAASLARVPAAWVLVALAVALFGLVPRGEGVAWAVLAAVVAVGEIGPLLELPQWAMDLSPFTHVPDLPGGPWRVLPLVLLLAVAAALAAAGLAGLRRRDLG